MTGFIILSHRLKVTPKSIYPDRVIFRLGGLNVATYMSIKRVGGWSKKNKVGERARDRSLGLALGKGEAIT